MKVQRDNRVKLVRRVQREKEVKVVLLENRDREAIREDKGIAVRRG